MSPRWTGCPCGCASRPRGYRDPDCILTRPLGPVIDYAALNAPHQWPAEAAGETIPDEAVPAGDIGAPEDYPDDWPVERAA